MNEQGAASAYRTATAQSASAVGRVVALFDTILRDFQRALAAVEAGNVQSRVFEMNHALTVIGELQGVLDFEAGGEAAKQFENFYNVARGLIVSANVNVSRESILGLIDLFKPVRQAWQEVDRKHLAIETIEARKAAAKAQSPAPSSPSRVTPTPSGETPSSSWSA
jgi:flagellar secretion chaperone FliS